MDALENINRFVNQVRQRIGLKKLFGYGAVLLIVGTAFCFSLAQVLDGSWVLPQDFGVGSLSVRFYGLIIGLSALAAYLLAKRRQSQYGIDDDFADNLLFAVLIGGFVGARLYHVLSELSFYFQNPELIFAIWRGGLSIFGAFLGGVATVILYTAYVSGLQLNSENLKTKILPILDWLTPSLVLGQIIGRYGNLFNYEAYGYPTSLPWKMFVPPGFRIAPYETANFFHPLFLYESIANLIILLVILYIVPKQRVGQLFFLWLILYNAVRFILETQRIDSVFIVGFRLNMIVSGILILVGLYFYRQLHVSQRPSNS